LSLRLAPEVEKEAAKVRAEWTEVQEWSRKQGRCTAKHKSIPIIFVEVKTYKDPSERINYDKN